MTDKERYKQLKEENDAKMNTLVDSYHFIANNYVLKARGYAEKNLDTEARIKDVLDELISFCDKGMPAPMAIPNTNEYIKEKISLLAKRKETGEKVKGIIWTVVFFTFIVSAVCLGLIFRDYNYLDNPTNITSTVTEDGKIEITFDKVKSASFGYYIYYMENDKETGKTYIEQPLDQNQTKVSIILDLDPEKSYEFYIYADDVTKGEGEEFLVIYKGSEHVKYVYTPKGESSDK